MTSKGFSISYLFLYSLEMFLLLNFLTSDLSFAGFIAEARHENEIGNKTEYEQPTPYKTVAVYSISQS